MDAQEQKMAENTTSPQQWAILFGTMLVVLISDQLSKAWIVANLALYEDRTPIPFLREVFEITYTQNTGAAFGLFSFAGNFFLIVAVIATGVIIYYYRKIEGQKLHVRIALGMQMGGALGNAIDRVNRGFVVDFLHVFYEPWGFDYPVFNIADSAIVIGVIILAIYLWREDSQEKKKEPDEELTQSESSQ